LETVIFSYRLKQLGFEITNALQDKLDVLRSRTSKNEGKILTGEAISFVLRLARRNEIRRKIKWRNALPFDFPQPSTGRVSLGKPGVNHAEWCDTSRNSNSNSFRHSVKFATTAELSLRSSHKPFLIFTMRRLFVRFREFLLFFKENVHIGNF